MAGSVPTMVTVFCLFSVRLGKTYMAALDVVSGSPLTAFGLWRYSLAGIDSLFSLRVVADRFTNDVLQLVSVLDATAEVVELGAFLRQRSVELLSFPREICRIPLFELFNVFRYPKPEVSQ